VEPGSARAALAAVLGAVEVDAVLATATGWPTLATGFRDLRCGLARAAEGVDVSREVIARIEPESGFDAAVTALSTGLDTDARRLDLADTVLERVVGSLVAEPSSAVAAAVAAEAGAAPSLADAVMDRLEDPVAIRIMAFLDGALAPEQRSAVTAHLAADPDALRAAGALAALGRDLRSAVKAETGTAAGVWPAVARELGFDRELAWGDAMEGLGASLRQEAPDLAGAVMEALAPAPAPAVKSMPRARRSQSVPVFAVLAAAAAATLLVVNVVRSTLVGEDREAAQEIASSLSAEPPIVLADSNETRIDALQVDSEAIVQVFQFEAGGPMIIYVDEGSSGGVVL
jgi:anti-sigma factor RsiW